MADQVQFRGGTTAEHEAFTGALREITIDTDKRTVVVHDGATPGGNPLMRQDLSNLPPNAPSLIGAQPASSILAGFVAGTTATSNKNILINGEVTRINQRGIAGWSAVAAGSYGYDGWKKVDANNITQIIEAGRFVPSSVYTLSGVGVTTQQVTSPASGNWTLPNIPITATNVQLELGSVATSFERRPVEHEWVSCKRYLRVFNSSTGFPAAGVVYSASHAIVSLGLGEGMRVAPSLTNVSATGVLFFGGFSVSWTTPVLQSAASCSIQIDITSSGMTVGQGASCGSITSGSIILSAELQS